MKYERFEDLPVPKDYILLGRLAVDDWADYRVLDRMLMYERRIESSMYRTMKEMEDLQKARKAEQAGANEEQSAQESPPPRRRRCDLKKQTQYSSGFMNTKGCTARSYGDKPREVRIENKANLEHDRGKDSPGSPCRPPEKATMKVK